MKDDASSQGWELEEGGDSEDRWVLEESEQQLADEWDLEGSPEPVGQWQPVEYDKPRRGGPAWILPTVVTIALLAVLGYSAVTLLPAVGDALQRGGLGLFRTPESEDPPAADAVVAEAEQAETETPTVEPTATPIPSDTPTEAPPTSTPAPTLSVAQQLFATVLNEYGVNARKAPSLDAEVLQILFQNDTFVVLKKLDDGWLQLFVSESALEAGQPISGVIGFAKAEYFAEALQPLAEEIWHAVLEEAGIPLTPTPEPPTPVAEATTAADLTLPTVTPIPPLPSEPVTDTATITESSDVTIIIDAVNGANVRTLPELNADVVRLLPDQAEVPAIGRYATNDWILVDLGDGATGWVYTELVKVVGEMSSLPATTLGELPPPSPTPTETPTPEPTPIAPPAEPPEPYSSELPAGVPGAIVFSVAGVNARDLPSADSDVITIVPENAALPVVGRTANGEWLQVEMPQGGVAWLFRAAIIPRGDVSGVPVKEGGTATTPQTETPEPTEVATAAPEVEGEPTAAATTEPAVAATVSMRQIVVPVFSIPDSDGERLVQYGRGTQLQATGQTADGVWIQVITTDGQTGYVSAKSVEVSVDAGTLPVVQ